MAFVVSSPTVPDFGTDLALKLWEEEKNAFTEGKNQLAQLYKVRDEAYSKIPTNINPEIRTKLEGNWKTLDEKINNLTQTLRTNPREFPYMSRTLTDLGLDFYNEFGATGATGRIGKINSEYEERKQKALDAGFTEADFNAFNNQDKMYGDAFSGKSVDFRNPPTRMNYNAAASNVVKSIIKDKYKTEEFEQVGDGKYRVGTSQEVVNISSEEINEWLSRDPNIQQYENYTKDVEGWNESKFIVRKDTSGRNIYYGAQYDKTGKPILDNNGNIKYGETTDANGAISRTEYERRQAIDQALKFYGEGSSKSFITDERLIGDKNSSNSNNKTSNEPASSLISPVANMNTTAKELEKDVTYTSVYNKLHTKKSEVNEVLKLIEGYGI